MRSNQKVSIILTNYNSNLFLKATINSIINQIYDNWQLIIVDDCSNKKTKSILKTFLNNKKIKIFWLKKIEERLIVEILRSKKQNLNILFIDSDDIWKKEKLEKQINYMEKNNYHFTFTNYETFGLKKKLIKPPKKLNFKNFIRNTSIGTSTMIINRKIARGIKFTNSKICEDYFYKCKILKKVNLAFCLNKFLTKYRVRNNSLQSNPIRNFYWIWKINNKHNKLSFLENFLSLFFI